VFPRVSCTLSRTCGDHMVTLVRGEVTPPPIPSPPHPPILPPHFPPPISWCVCVWCTLSLCEGSEGRLLLVTCHSASPIGGERSDVSTLYSYVV
jgi:hypothetical protein